VSNVTEKSYEITAVFQYFYDEKVS